MAAMIIITLIVAIASVYCLVGTIWVITYLVQWPPKRITFIMIIRVSVYTGHQKSPFQYLTGLIHIIA